MRVGLVTGRRRLELLEMPAPEAAPHKAVVEIAYCGICGTDLHAYQSGDPYSPAICGHEWTGAVTACGPGVSHVREGDRVGIGVSPPCGRCEACRAGDPEHCASVIAGMIGADALAPAHGGFAPAIAVDASRLFVLPDALSDEEAAMLEPTTVAVHAVRRTGIRLGDGVLVLGAGPIGLLTLQCARAAGARKVVVVEPHAGRRRLALELGASASIDPQHEAIEERVREEIGALGPEVVFECAGIPSTIDRSVALVRPGGRVGLVGMATVPAEIVPATWLIKEVRLVASLGYLHHEFAIASQLIADGRVRVAPLHTSTVSLAEIESAFQRLLEAASEVKVLVDPRA